ncbi:hypothetical protein J6590_037499 [Homalodisca vitripennis]|nr:hypothetical protein J6590_037499 [Homalodisca vitripennis]
MCRTKNMPPQILHPWEQPSSTWERIHVDYAGATDGYSNNHLGSILSTMCTTKNMPPQILHPWEQPSSTWGRIRVDCAGATDGQQYLIVVDAFTVWTVVPTRTATTTWTVYELRAIFSTFGFRHFLVLVDSTQFTSQECVNVFGIIHSKQHLPSHRHCHFRRKFLM